MVCQSQRRSFVFEPLGFLGKTYLAEAGELPIQMEGPKKL